MLFDILEREMLIYDDQEWADATDYWFYQELTRDDDKEPLDFDEVIFDDDDDGSWA